MESDNRDLIRTLERAEAAPFVDYPRTPRWLGLAVGAWCAFPLLVWRLGSVGDAQTNITLSAVIDVFMFLLDLIEGVGLFLFAAWSRRYYGMSQWKLVFARKPREIRGAYWLYYLGVVVLVGLIAGVYLLGGWIIAMVVGFIAGTLGYWGFDVFYGRQAAKVRARLGAGL